MLRMLPAGHRQRIRFALTREPPSPHLKIQLEFRRGPNLKFSTGPQTGPTRRTSTIGNPVCIMSRLQLVKNTRTVPRSSASRGICTAKYHIIAILSIPREGNHPTHRLDGDRLGLKVVAPNLLPARQVCLVERHGHTVGQANTPKPEHQCPEHQCKVVRDGFVGCHDAVVEEAGGRVSPQACISSSKPVSSVSFW